DPTDGGTVVQPYRSLRANGRGSRAVDAGPKPSRRPGQSSLVLGPRRAARASGADDPRTQVPTAPAGDLQAPGRGIRARTATDVEVPSRDGVDGPRRVRPGNSGSGQ